jgi:hypothetical protein
VNCFSRSPTNTIHLDEGPSGGLPYNMDPNVDYWKVPAATPPDGITPNFVNPPSVGYQQTTTNIVVLVIMIIVVLLRLYTRIFIVKSFGYDDCT